MIWMQLLIIAALTAVSLVIFYFIRMYVLPRYHIRKNYLLLFLVFLFFVPIFFAKQYTTSQFLQYGQVLLVSLTFLTYLEIARMDKEKKNKPIVGRPKPKPNRIKEKDEK